MRCDVAIAGCGVAGAVTGYVSARLGRDTIIVDTPALHRPGEALADGGVSAIERLGLSELVHIADHVDCSGLVHVGRPSAGPSPWRGIILDRGKFEAELVAAACAAGCRHVRGEVRSVRPDADGHVLAVHIPADVVEIEARIVVDASGRAGGVARRLGGLRHVLTNLVASWTMLPHGAIAGAPGLLAIEAMDSEWWYVAVGRRSIAAAALGRKPPRGAESWIAAAHSTTILRGLAVSTIQPVAQAANVSLMRPVCGDNWFAVGDAAATFDPLSGYGLTFAIGTGHAAACAADARLRGERVAPLAYSALVTDRITRSMSGLGEAYRALAAAPIAMPPTQFLA